MVYSISKSHVNSQQKGSPGEETTTTTNNSNSRGCLCQFVVDNQYHPNRGGLSGNGGDVDDTSGGRGRRGGAVTELLDSSSSLLLRCPACVAQSLKPYKERHAQAIRDHQEAKQNCARALNNHNYYHQRLSTLQAESQQKRDRLTTMRKQCNDMAVRVASQAIENDRHRENATEGQRIELQTQYLSNFNQEVLETSIGQSIETSTNQIRSLRFQWARKALAMSRLDIDLEDVKLTQLQRRRQQKQPNQIIQRQARGIGKIGGLPLPHAGPELYGVLPPKELQSALRLVASVTCTVARCLGIILPHTILLKPSDCVGDIADTVSEDAVKQKANEITNSNITGGIGGEKQQQSDRQQQQPVGSSSIYSLMDGSYWKNSAKKVAKNALARATGQSIVNTSSSGNNEKKRLSSAAGNGIGGSAEKQQQSVIGGTSHITPPSLDTSQVSIRIHHATAAVIAEDDQNVTGGGGHGHGGGGFSSSSSKYSLSADGMNQQDFAIALQLLQNNVIVLCIRAGVPVSRLWPAEAMLLNLHALDLFIQQQIAVSF